MADEAVHQPGKLPDFRDQPARELKVIRVGVERHKHDDERHNQEGSSHDRCQRSPGSGRPCPVPSNQPRALLQQVAGETKRRGAGRGQKVTGVTGGRAGTHYISVEIIMD